MKYYKSIIDMFNDVVAYIRKGNEIECDNSMETLVFGIRCKSVGDSWYIKYADYVKAIEKEFQPELRRTVFRILCDLPAQNAVLEALRNKANKKKNHLTLVRSNE